ncbi:MAG: Wzz/FepE/Etk N-terminal domain-containing protein [Psychrilyobacter sp.]|uniref:Wzz/FepE/Etk N-terminal domain-containing protein n=1 Tax=Psychrilyobacter sp. TaxID=2586924 RepID=UPI003C70F387
MTKEILKYEVRKYDDEIDLVDLLKILIKNKGLILLTTIIITAFSVGGALYIKSNRVEKFGQNFILRDFSDSYYREKAQLKIKDFNLEEMLLDDNIVDEFYSNEDFNKYSLERIKDERTTSDDKRKFLQDSVELKRVNGDKVKFKYYTLSTMIEDEVLSKKMIELYLNIINVKKTELLEGAIEEQGSLVLPKRDLYRAKVKEDEKKITEIIKKRPAAILENQSIMSILTVTNPTLMQEMESNKELYKKYYTQAIGIEGLKEDKNLKNQIEKVSSVYKVEEKSKSKMIVAIGLIMGLFLGVFAAFMKEFIANVNLKN